MRIINEIFLFIMRTLSAAMLVLSFFGPTRSELIWIWILIIIVCSATDLIISAIKEQ